MSYCKRNGKDKSIFVTQDDISNPSVVSSLVEEDEAYGIVKPDGSINWDCPCLGDMPHGPCGEQFKDAFSCFYHSSDENEEERGVECIPQFKTMLECFKQHPDLYSQYAEDEDGEGEGELTVTEPADTSNISGEGGVATAISPSPVAAAAAAVD